MHTTLKKRRVIKTF